MSEEIKVVNKSGFSSWCKVVCPSCGSGALKHDDKTSSLNCPKCASQAKCSENVIDWSEEMNEGDRNVEIFTFSKLKRLLNPISSPLLPFRYISNFRIESFYKRTLSEEELAKNWMNHFFDGLDIPQKPVVLDCGCGRGRNVGLMTQLGWKVAGQDIYKHPWWQRFEGSGFQVLNLKNKNLPWVSESFDLGISVGLIHYMGREELSVFFQEMQRVIRPGGSFMLLEANSESYGKSAFQLPNCYTLEETKSIAVASGFDVLDSSYEGFYAPIFPLLINFIRRNFLWKSFDLSDYDSWVSKRIPMNRRGHWLLRLHRR